jgi:arylsulfatase
MAESGITFENAIAPGPRTPTSIPEILTGEPVPHFSPGSYGAQVERFANHLERHRTLPERLSELGYTTVAFTTNPWTSTRCGVDETFDEFYDMGTLKPSSVRDLSSSLLSGTQAARVALWFERWRQKRRFFSQWPSFFEELAEVVEDLPEPYFLWVFLMDTHNPYIVSRRDRAESSLLSMYYGLLRGNTVFSHPSGQSYFKHELPPHVEEFVKRAYRDAVRSVDRFVGNLAELTQNDDPLLVFNSDHGEAFNEHDTYGHQQALYEENVRVPLLVSGADEDRGRRVSSPISLRTLPELLTAYSRDGTPITSDEWVESYVVARSEDGSKIAVRSQDSKYISTADGAEVYDLTTDPRETQNIADRVDTTPFEKRIEEYLKTVPSRDRERADVEVSRDVQRRLSLLGYDE